MIYKSMPCLVLCCDENEAFFSPRRFFFFFPLFLRELLSHLFFIHARTALLLCPFLVRIHALLFFTPFSRS